MSRSEMGASWPCPFVAPTGPPRLLGGRPRAGRPTGSTLPTSRGGRLRSPPGPPCRAVGGSFRPAGGFVSLCRVLQELPPRPAAPVYPPLAQHPEATLQSADRPEIAGQAQERRCRRRA